MKRKKLKRLIALAFSCIFISNGFSGISVKALEPIVNNENEITITIPNLNPTPQEVQVTGEGFTITSSVNIIGENEADKDAIRVLKEFLAINNIKINENTNKSSTTLVIGEVEDNIEELDLAKQELKMKGADELKAQGYVLAMDKKENSPGTIVIEGKDEVGTFYGVQTLTQLVNKKGEDVEASEVVISDEPSMSSRGIVEGFYGTPWTQEDRLDQIKFYGKNKMNMYIYAPKDDPYHREQWRQPYPESEMKRMGELIETSKRNKVDFVFAISPGGDIRFDGAEGEEDFQALLNKAESLYDMGVRSFAIYFDDIADKSGVKQATVLNRFNEEFVKAKGDITPLITVPTEYDTSAMGKVGSLSTYTKDFSETLNSDIKVMWTGEVVVSEGISLENAQLVNSIYGKRMAIWWNYPVTDYMKTKLALGPIYNIDTTLADEVDIFTMNPMENAELSKVTLHTGADYGWNTDDYDYDKTWNRAIEMLYGDLAEDFKIFANHSTRMDGGWAFTGRQDAPEMRAAITELWAKLINGDKAELDIAMLYSDFSRMEEAAVNLKISLPKEALEECSDQLDKFLALAQADKIALDMIVAQRDGDIKTYEKLKTESIENAIRLKNGVKISEKVALSFISEAINFDPTMVNPRDVRITASSEEMDREVTPATNASDLDLGTFWHSQWSSPAPNPDYLVLELDKVYTIDKLRFVPRQDGGTNSVTEGTILTSLDGENYTEVARGKFDTSSAIKFVNFEPTKAKYVKFLVSKSTNQHGAAAEINVYKTQVEEEIIVEKPSNFKGNTTNEIASLTWEMPKSTVGLVEYIIYKDGKELETIEASKTSYTVKNLKANTIYGFKITAKYSNGEESKPVSVNLRTKKK